MANKMYLRKIKLLPISARLHVNSYNYNSEMYMASMHAVMLVTTLNIKQAFAKCN